jgi:hypothetical protein
MSSIRARFAAILLVGATLAMSTAASSETIDCRTDPRFRALDYALGSWVVSSSGKAVANVTMTSILKGCAIKESWTATPGNSGDVEGVFGYSIQKQGWLYAFFTDYANDNYFLGQVSSPGKIVWNTVQRQNDGRERLRRWTFSRLEDGRLLENSVGSDDGGVTWSNEYDLYWAPAGKQAR